MSGELDIQNSLERTARLKQATEFLSTILLPRLGLLKSVDPQTFQELLAKFKADNPGLGSDFEVSHLWSGVYSRQLISRQNSRLSGGRPSGNQRALNRAMNLLTELETKKE